jgi:Do/DeqQ family serine protease
MTVRRLLLSVLLLISGFVAGLVLTGRMRASGDASEAQAQRAATAVAPAPSAGAPVGVPVGAVPDFTQIAERTVPAVANISSLQVVRRPNSPFSNDPFFRYFFGDDGDTFGFRRGVESSLGSGVIVSADGYILTNNHVVAGDSGRISLRQLPAITVALADKREMEAEIIGVDPATDLALLKIAARNLPTIPWGDSSKLKVAEWVLAIGNPYQLNQSVSLGIVSAVGRTNVGISAYEDFIQTDAAINPGNSGGALVNARGELVGINTAIFSQSGGYQGIGFAVASNLARRIVSELQQYGEVRRGSIGYVEIAPLTTQVAEELGAPEARGILIRRMRRDSAAYDGGLRPGDIVISFNGATITDGSQLSRLIQDSRIGTTASVTVIREGRRLELKIPIERSNGN